MGRGGSPALGLLELAHRSPTAEVTKYCTHLVTVEDQANNPDDAVVAQAIAYAVFIVKEEWVTESSQLNERQEESRFCFEATQHQARFDDLLRMATGGEMTLSHLQAIEKVHPLCFLFRAGLADARSFTRRK